MRAYGIHTRSKSLTSVTLRLYLSTNKNCPGDKKRRDVSTDENLDETGQAQNIIFRREVVLEGGRVVRNTRDPDSEPESNRPTRNEGEEKGPVRDGGELVGQIKTGLQIIDPVLAKSVALLVERGKTYRF